MDRKHILYDYLAFVATVAFFVFLALIPNQEFRTPYGVNVLVWDIIVAAGAVDGGFLFYLLFPTQDKYIVSLTQEPDKIKMREIHVLLPSGEVMKREAHFFIVRIGVPMGTQNAEEIKLLYRHPTSNDLFELQNIQATGVPHIIVRWASQDIFLSNVPEKFATALVDAKEGKVQHLNLTSGEHHVPLVPLVFFFTVSGSDAVYFPSSYMRAYIMPIKFETELYIEAKGRRQKLLTILEVNAERWDNVAVSEKSNPVGVKLVS